MGKCTSRHLFRQLVSASIGQKEQPALINRLAFLTIRQKYKAQESVQDVSLRRYGECPDFISFKLVTLKLGVDSLLLNQY